MESNLAISKGPDVSKSNALFERARKLIPAGTMLLSKRPDVIAPGSWPAYYRRAWGCKVEDLDGNVFVDFTGDLGSSLLGRADPDVDAAVNAAVGRGSFCMLNVPEEVDLAQLLTEIVPCAEQVRFAKGGGETNLIAIRIARGYTRRDLVAFCGYHGWHDWYLAANLAEDRNDDGKLLPGFPPLGVPRQLLGTAMPFEYNNIDSLKELLESRPGQFAAIIMEATRFDPPADGFLAGVRELADQHGVVLIFDEVVTGFRMALGGAQEYFSVTPDMATFAKTISNGYPMGAVVGRREIMGTVNDQFISSTYWTDSLGTAAALATLQKIRRTEAIAHVWRLGNNLKVGLEDILRDSGIQGRVQGWPPIVILSFQHEDARMARSIKTFYVRRQLARGFLATGPHYLMTAHTNDDIREYLAATRETLRELKASLARDSVLEDIDFRPSKPLFKRLA